MILREKEQTLPPRNRGKMSAAAFTKQRCPVVLHSEFRSAGFTKFGHVLIVVLYC